MLTPLPSSKWDYDAAGHLLVRAGFGGSLAEIQDLTDRGMQQGLEKLLNPVSTESIPPTWAYPNSLSDLVDQIRSSATPEEKATARRAFNQANQGQMADLIQWWTQQMTDTRAPLLEKMTLFWHGHFATSAAKVKPAYKMWVQNQTLRAHALGNFGTLTKAVSRDPAMLVWLDLASSQKEQPNENFARELMELFTLGEGNYTENDIKESAKAFTGYRINRMDQQFRFAPNQFDSSIKVFMKKAGPWTGDQIIDIILEQSQCARFVVTKIWRFFVYEDPDAALVEALATKFRRANYEIKPLLRTIFSSEEFYSDRAKGAIIKSPVQYLVQARRSLGVYTPGGRALANIYRRLGQVPFYPPNVKGWDGGKSWINTGTLTYRYQIARALITGIRPEQAGLPKFPAKTAAATSPEPMEQNAIASSPSKLDIGTPAPAPTPFPPLTPAWPVEKYVDAEDRNDFKRLLEKLYSQIFQSRPQPDLLKNFVEVASNKTLPLDDRCIRDLVMLMLTTPNYQVS
jgi:Uncharacterized protein conserved in bacteria